jgi:hypothetical protein
MGDHEDGSAGRVDVPNEKPRNRLQTVRGGREERRTAIPGVIGGRTPQWCKKDRPRRSRRIVRRRTIRGGRGKAPSFISCNRPARNRRGDPWEDLPAGTTSCYAEPIRGGRRRRRSSIRCHANRRGGPVKAGPQVARHRPTTHLSAETRKTRSLLSQVMGARAIAMVP